MKFYTVVNNNDKWTAVDVANKLNEHLIATTGCILFYPSEEIARKANRDFELDGRVVPIYLSTGDDPELN